MDEAAEGTLERRLRSLREAGSPAWLREIRRGIEKESLRITADGELADTDHPAALGSALTNPYITTDYAESQLELITPPTTEYGRTLACLTHIHQFVYRHIGDERLWVNSMPCILRGEDSIRIAEYGSSNSGRMKHIYRRGLHYRYGRLMQTISGIHYNFSLPENLWQHLHDVEQPAAGLRDYISSGYFATVRNFRRYVWLYFYLFGASPAVCPSFVAGREHDLEPLGDRSLHLPWATSLRMSGLGYQSRAQEAINVCYNTLGEYVESLTHAVDTPYPPYERIGVRRDGEWLQLSANLLQIDNEYYTVIRPKRRAASGERPTRALARRGVEYLEVRCVDIDPFLPVGIDNGLQRFLDLFLLYCSLEESQRLDDRECDEADENSMRAVRRGREPGLALVSDDREVPLTQWASRLLDRMQPVAEALDQAWSTTAYTRELDRQRDKVADSTLTPSARVLDELRANGESFFEFGLRKAEEHRQAMTAAPLDPEAGRELTDAAERSIEEQRTIESADDIPFEEFLERYFRG